MKSKVFFLFIFIPAQVCLGSDLYTTHYSDTSALDQQMMQPRPVLSESVITMQKRNVKAALLGRSPGVASVQGGVYSTQPSMAQKVSTSIFEYFNTKFEHVCAIFNNVISLFLSDIRNYIRACDYTTMSQIKFLIPLSQQLQREYEELLAQQEALAQAALEKDKQLAPQGATQTQATLEGEEGNVVPAAPPVAPAPLPPVNVPKKFKNDFLIYNFKYAGSGPLHKGFQGFHADIESAAGIARLHKPLFFAFKKARFEHAVVISGAHEFWLKVFMLIYNTYDKKVSQVYGAAQMLMLCWRLSKTPGIETVEKAYEARAPHLLQFFKTISFQGVEVLTFTMKCYAFTNQLRALESDTKVSSAALNDFGALTKKLIALVLGMLEKYDHLIERRLEKKESKIGDLYKELCTKDLNLAPQREEAFKIGKQLHGLLDGWNDFMQLLSKKVEALLSVSPLYKQQARVIDALYLDILDPFLSHAFITWYDIKPGTLASQAPQAAQGGEVSEKPQFSFDLMKEIVNQQ